MSKIKELIRFDWFVKFMLRDKAKKVLDQHNILPEEKENSEVYYYNLREENSWARTRKVELRDAEKRAKIEVAKEMKQNGESIEKIKRYTGLSEVEIESL
jgi:predicted transposase/invertase (TIGR01784 family)